MIRFWHQLLPAYIFTRPIIIGTFLWALLVHFADSINNDSGNVTYRIVIISCLHLGVYGALFIIKQLLLDRVKPNFVPPLTLLALFVVALFRGFLLEHWLFAWEITQSLDIGLRMRTSTVNTVSSFSIAIIATASARSHQMKNAHLHNELVRLESIQTHALAEIESVDSQAIEIIRADLKAYVDSMQGRSIDKVLVILKEMIDKVVQPISRRLENEVNLWTPPVVEEAKVRVNWFQAFKDGLHPGKINYVFVPTVMIFSSLPTVLKNTAFTMACIYLLFTYMVGVLIGKMFKKLFESHNVNYLLYSLVTLITGFAMGLTTLIMTRDYDSPFGFLPLATIFYPITAAFISMTTSADEQISNDTRKLATTAQALEWNIARIRETQHQNQRNLARSLHGSIQAKLASSYLELERTSFQDPAAKNRLDQIIDELQLSIAGITNARQSDDDLHQLMAKIQENWESVAEISYSVTEFDLAMLHRDQLCMATIFDAIPELVFNAIKHGAANKIHISAGFNSDRVVQLMVEDNGVEEEIGIGSGLGTKILNDSSLSWKRNRHNGKTITQADFAFSANF